MFLRYNTTIPIQIQTLRAVALGWGKAQYGIITRQRCYRLRRAHASILFKGQHRAASPFENFTGTLKRHGVMISMDGKRRCMDNIFVERQWRSLKYEEVYLPAYATAAEARTGIADGWTFTTPSANARASAIARRGKFTREGLRICGWSALPTGCASPLPEPAQKAGKCSLSTTYPQKISPSEPDIQ